MEELEQARDTGADNSGEPPAHRHQNLEITFAKLTTFIAPLMEESIPGFAQLVKPTELEERWKSLEANFFESMRWLRWLAGHPRDSRQIESIGTRVEQLATYAAGDGWSTLCDAWPASVPPTALNAFSTWMEEYFECARQLLDDLRSNAGQDEWADAGCPSADISVGAQVAAQRELLRVLTAQLVESAWVVTNTLIPPGGTCTKAQRALTTSTAALSEFCARDLRDAIECTNSVFELAEVIRRWQQHLQEVATDTRVVSAMLVEAFERVAFVRDQLLRDLASLAMLLAEPGSPEHQQAREVRAGLRDAAQHADSTGDGAIRAVLGHGRPSVRYKRTVPAVPRSVPRTPAPPAGTEIIRRWKELWRPIMEDETRFIRLFPPAEAHSLPHLNRAVFDALATLDQHQGARIGNDTFAGPFPSWLAEVMVRAARSISDQTMQWQSDVTRIARRCAAELMPSHERLFATFEQLCKHAEDVLERLVDAVELLASADGMFAEDLPRIKTSVLQIRACTPRFARALALSPTSAQQSRTRLAELDDRRVGEPSPARQRSTSHAGTGRSATSQADHDAANKAALEELRRRGGAGSYGLCWTPEKRFYLRAGDASTLPMTNGHMFRGELALIRANRGGFRRSLRGIKNGHAVPRDEIVLEKPPGLVIDVEVYEFICRNLTRMGGNIRITVQP